MSIKVKLDDYWLNFPFCCVGHQIKMKKKTNENKKKYFGENFKSAVFFCVREVILP